MPKATTMTVRRIYRNAWREFGWENGTAGWGIAIDTLEALQDKGHTTVILTLGEKKPQNYRLSIAKLIEALRKWNAIKRMDTHTVGHLPEEVLHTIENPAYLQKKYGAFGWKVQQSLSPQFGAFATLATLPAGMIR